MRFEFIGFRQNKKDDIHSTVRVGHCTSAFDSGGKVFHRLLQCPKFVKVQGIRSLRIFLSVVWYWNGCRVSCITGKRRLGVSFSSCPLVLPPIQTEHNNASRRRLTRKCHDQFVQDDMEEFTDVRHLQYINLKYVLILTPGSL